MSILEQVPEHPYDFVTSVKGDNFLLHYCRTKNMRDGENTNIYPSTISDLFGIVDYIASFALK